MMKPDTRDALLFWGLLTFIVTCWTIYFLVTIL